MFNRKAESCLAPGLTGESTNDTSQAFITTSLEAQALDQG